MNITKVTGNKKPLSSLTTEVAKLKGAVLYNILNNLLSLSNIVSARQVLKLAILDYEIVGNSYDHV